MKLIKFLAQNKERAEQRQQEILDAIELRGTEPTVNEAIELARLYREILDCDFHIKEIMDSL